MRRPAKAKISEKEIKEISKKIFNQNSDLFIDCNVTEVMNFHMIITDDEFKNLKIIDTIQENKLGFIK